MATVNYTGPVAAPTKAPVTGYLKVRQMGADGNYHVTTMLASKMSPAQLAAAKVNGLNGAVAPPKTAANTGMVPGSTAPANQAGMLPTAPAPAAKPQSLIPRVSVSAKDGLNATTGQIDWTAILNAAQTISAVDPQYALDLSNNIMQAQQSIAPIQAEYSALSKDTIDPITGLSTGKKKYQVLGDAENSTFGQNQSSVYGNAARRGISSSGMTNSNVAKNNVLHSQNLSSIDEQFGPTHMTNLYSQMLGALGQQDQSNTAAYYAALARQQATIPSVAGAAGLTA